MIGAAVLGVVGLAAALASLPAWCVLVCWLAAYLWAVLTA